MIDISRWEHKGHTFGQCVYNGSDGNMAYVNIPKNASVWTKNRLISLGWEEGNYYTDSNQSHDFHKKTFIVALRDPVDRWCSGIAEYFTIYHPGVTINHLYPQMLDLIFDRVTFDDHTEKQVCFIEGCDIKNCVFLKVNQQYKLSFSNYLKLAGIPNRFDTLAVEHRTLQGNKHKLLRYFTQLVEKEPRYLKQLKEYYKQDYNLLNTVNFYGTR